MTEYITKEQAIDEVWDAFTMRDDPDLGRVIEENIERFPPADVAPVRHATTTAAGWDEIYCQWKTCNRCQGDNVSTAIYCNWCGAQMDGGESDG